MLRKSLFAQKYIEIYDFLLNHIDKSETKNFIYISNQLRKEIRHCYDFIVILNEDGDNIIIFIDDHNCVHTRHFPNTRLRFQHEVLEFLTAVKHVEF